MYNQNIANIFDHIQDYSKWGLENKFLENKSGRIFFRSTGLLYKFLPTNLGVCKPTFYNFFHHIRGETVLFIIHTSDRMRYFANFQDKLHSVNIQDDHSWALSETVQNISKITHTATLFSFLLCELSVWSSVWMNCNRVTLQHNNEFIIVIFCFLTVSIITMCNILKCLIRATFFSTPASDVHEQWKQIARTISE